MILCWTIAPTNVGNVLKKKKLYVLEHYCDQNQSYSAYNNNTENKSVFISIYLHFIESSWSPGAPQKGWSSQVHLV